MTNSSVYFVLSAYFDVGLLKYLYFVLVLLLYVSTVCANVLLILVICLNRSLHEPMYVFLVSLFLNELFGSAGLFPFLLVQLLSDPHHVSSSLCFLQNVCLYSYGGSEYLNLAVMSYDRYLAICRPLRYNAQMTASRIAALIAVSWFCPLFLCLVMTSLSRSLRLCGNIIPKVYCDNYSIVKLSCSDTSINNFYGLLISSLCIFCPLLLIFFSYLKILKICFSGSEQMRQKAVSTCSPHLASLINFTCGACFEIVQSRFDMKDVPNLLRILLSLYWLTCQPLLSPLLYGLNFSSLRGSICKHLSKHLQTPTATSV